MKLNWLAALGGMALTACTSDGDKVTDKPLNIVLINLDDAGNGDFSFKGAVGYETPNIDCLAAEGMSMTNFYAVQPISGASRAGLMTGCYPNRIGFAYAPNPNAKTGISDKEETIAELLKAKGYGTAIFGKWHLGTPVSSCRCSMGLMSTTVCRIRTICGRIIRSMSSRICL